MELFLEMKNFLWDFFGFWGWAEKTSYLSSVPPLGSGRWRKFFGSCHLPRLSARMGDVFLELERIGKELVIFFWENNFFIFELNNSLNFFLGWAGAAPGVPVPAGGVLPVPGGAAGAGAWVWAAWAIGAVPFGFGWLGLFRFLFLGWKRIEIII